jgi:ATP-dependent DNA ligase
MPACPAREVRGLTRTARTDDLRQRDAARDRQPGWLTPELATLTKDRFSDPAWIFERKLDGERCLAFRAGQQLRLMTRNQRQVGVSEPSPALRAEVPVYLYLFDVLWADGRDMRLSAVHRVEPRLVTQIGFTEWTADGQLRHPRFQGLRRDKEPADVMREMP